MKIIERLVIILIVFIGVLYGANTGTITGYVADPSGAIVPGAALSLKSDETGAVTRTKSDNHGFYQFLQVPPGRYDLSVEASGFRKVVVNNINVLVEQSVSYNVKLEVGQVSETVEVKGGVSALIEPEKVATSSNIAPSMVQNLPVTNRTFDSFWALAPGTTQAAAGS